ncbi:MAG: PEP-CTERM sorting domain-containing protein [Rhizobacter sp.]|nr:PEP-CTERM sorting domain-containing protein [Rhizobacter sp.]
MLVAVASPAHATRVVDTGTPNGSPIGAFILDGTDFYAGQVSFASNARIDAVSAHILGGAAGETFTVALYGDSASHLPGTLLQSATATFGSDGWNGPSALSGWNVSAGSYWIALEVGANDTLGQGSITGALLDHGVPNPLAHTAFNAGGGYQAAQLDFGLRVDATVAAVPEPETYLLMMVGLAAVTATARRRPR